MTDKTRTEVELDFLTVLEQGDAATQMALSQRIRVSVGLVNALLKRAVHKGYVKAAAAPLRRYAYYLTPKGFSEKSRLVADYLELSLEFFRRARQDYSEIFSRARACGIQQVILFGSGELAEIALLAARDADVEVVGVYDREANRSRLHGIEIITSLDAVVADVGFVVTDARTPQAAYDTIAGRYSDERIFAPDFLRITRVDDAMVEGVIGQ